MMSNKNKGILIFAILYTVLFVFDGVKLQCHLPLQIILFM
ncbi:caax amino protease family protein [Streptococcus pneumoniae]|nr:caax amino protease family protein [Streptococcus pneumoniae]VJV76379.1 caax amino protease family protein [Streptococcus pneumoniae]VKA50864.1 caax amino protease family protein [Streptococcus pneumoniae]VKE37424.1 caax amino protease family protein [Streptococcus pneumoniae]VLX70295.1 caax amino protease family protein [Streptococcus pneumoniae]